ncbi:MAG TPA: transglutaminase domain-containing protein, partial [Desulfuromonadales bacterium]|nr:transglutaminase domain-containing protein [Desulfuromonadales bacterium]
ERFRQQGEQAAALGGVADERHRALVDRYRPLIAELTGLLDNLMDRDIATPADLERALELIGTILSPVRPALHGTLPYQSLPPLDDPPTTVPQIQPAYRLAGAGTAAADLAGAPEAPLNERIAEQARRIAAESGKLSWDPVDLFEWVKNNIATEWYWGAMKGAEETLRQGSGNDADQAALLVALLRVAGYPARYVRGVIAFPGGVDGLRGQIGIQDPAGILAFLRKAGIPCRPVMDGAAIVNIEFEHVWVETRVPYANYRGSLGDASGPLWLPLDPSIKVAGYHTSGSIDLFSQPDNPLPELVASYLADERSETPLEMLQARLETWLADKFPGYGYPDLLNRRQPVTRRLHILPATLPYREVAVTGEYANLPAELVQSVTIRLAWPEPVLELTLPLHQAANRSLVVGFEPESVADHEIINLYGGLDNTPAHLVRLRPVLEIDGQRHAVAPAGLAVGEGFELAVTLQGPTRSRTVTNQVRTGYPLVLGLVAQQVVMPPEPGEPEMAAAHLHRAALAYSDAWNRAEQEFADLLDLALARPLPSLVTLGGSLQVAALLDIPLQVDLSGLFIDADLRAAATAVRPDVADARERLFMQLSALHGSVLEHRVFEDRFDLPAVSTAKLFGLAASAQVPVLTIDADNQAELLPALDLAPQIAADILDAANRGWTVRIPQQPLGLRDWQGSGYVKEDPGTGAAGYMLSGGIAGGATVSRVEAWHDLLQFLFRHPFSLPPNADPDSAMTIRKIAATDWQVGTAGAAFGEPLTVYVRDAEGIPVRGASVVFTVLEGGGLLRTEAEEPVTGTTLSVSSDWRGLARVT